MPLNAKQQKQFDIVCERIAEGMSLPDACKLDSLPTSQYVNRWINRDESGEIVSQYVRACEARSEARIEEMMHIADTEEDVQRAKLKIDTIKWTASKLKPKKYGDTKDHNVTGALTVEVIQTFAKPAPDNS